MFFISEQSGNLLKNFQEVLLAHQTDTIFLAGPNCSSSFSSKPCPIFSLSLLLEHKLFPGSRTCLSDTWIFQKALFSHRTNINILESPIIEHIRHFRRPYMQLNRDIFSIRYLLPPNRYFCSRSRRAVLSINIYYFQQIGPTCIRKKDEQPCGVGKCIDNCKEEKGYKCECEENIQEKDNKKCVFRNKSKSCTLFSLTFKKSCFLKQIQSQS